MAPRRPERSGGGSPAATSSRDTSSAAVSRERVVAGLLGLLGMSTLGTGLYFLFFRPAMLPEDFRFIGLDPEQLPVRMSEWLGIVFRTWGGFMVGFGLVLLGVAAYLETARKVLLRWAAATGLVVAFGRFFVSNLALRSDYLVFIAIVCGLAAITAAGLASLSGRRTVVSSTESAGPASRAAVAAGVAHNAMNVAIPRCSLAVVDEAPINTQENET